MGAKKLPPSLLPCKKITNLDKVPKSIISRAKREKMKRQHLNELFLNLSYALDIREQNSGKVFILDETTKIVKLMIDQIKLLKEENATLLSESQYVTIETNELKDETRALEIQIGELKSLVQKNLDPNECHVDSQDVHLTPLYQQVAVLNPNFLVPACGKLQVGPDQDIGAVCGNTDSSYVSKYPTLLDSWPSQLLEEQPANVWNE